jgi:peptidylprolyl isomerase
MKERFSIMRRVFNVVLLLVVSIIFWINSAGAGALEVVKDNVNVRQEPDVGSRILVRINSGHMLDELQKIGRWYEVRVAGMTDVSGWIFEAMVGPVPVEPSESPVVAQMGEVSLSGNDLEAFINLLDDRSQKKIRASPDAIKRVIREEIVRKVILQQAFESGFHQDPQIIQLMERARMQALADHFLSEQTKVDQSYPDDAEVISYFQANVAKYTTPEMLHIAQIFLAAPFDADEKEEDKTRVVAMKIAELVRQDGADFTKLALEHSEHQPTAQIGGDLGWLKKEALQPDVQQVFASMVQDETSNPVRSTQGWHIFKLLGRKDKNVRSLSEIAGEISEELRRNKAKNNREMYLQQLLDKEEIVIDDKVLDEVVGK